MTTPVNLEELEKLERKATKGPWRARPDGSIAQTSHVTREVRSIPRVEADAFLVAALRNAAPALFQELRELREENARAIAWLDRMSWANATIDTKTTSKGPLEIQLADALAERDSLRAEVEWLKVSVDALNRTANEYADAARETESGKREMVLEEQLVAARAQLVTAREDALEEAAMTAGQWVCPDDYCDHRECVSAEEIESAIRALKTTKGTAK